MDIVIPPKIRARHISQGRIDSRYIKLIKYEYEIVSACAWSYSLERQRNAIPRK